ncbi:hypothetical protein [Streptomyces sp. NPDC008141]|uniref:hypothetical protein n=1 Tax=Streptomyces sp. NPDC008141 TaxID=3364815 RepID=UPI0036EF0538
MSISVHALAHRPLTADAVGELVALPTGPTVPDDFDDVDAELQHRGWGWESDLLHGSFRTGHGHVLCTDGRSPFGHPVSRNFLVFGELYPVDPEDEDMANGTWLFDAMDDWQQLPGWTGRRPGTDQDCDDVLTQAALAVTEHLGRAPERSIRSSAAVVMPTPVLTHRIWRTATHALVLGPASDNGPYGYLTHLQLSCTPLTCGPDLPAADDEVGLARWITTHVDW